MRVKTAQEQTAAARQVGLISSALEAAVRSDGYWMNPKGKRTPTIYPKGAPLSPFNAMILMLHSDTKDYSTGIYTTFKRAHDAGNTVLKDERSVPMNWYNWNKYVNRSDDQDVIDREQYLTLTPDQQKEYKAVRQREIRSLFNIEQTSFPSTEEKQFEELKQKYGGLRDRGNLTKEERQLRSEVSGFRGMINTFLVPIRKSTSGLPEYNPQKDAIYMPDQKQFPEYEDYVRELVRKAVSATGHRERLSREGMVMNGGRAPSEDSVKYEKLVTELATGIKMADYGLPARISEENLDMVEHWSQELKENPCLIDAVESDINNALDVIKKAEKGEKVEFAHAKNRQETSELKKKEGPNVSVTDALIMTDILRHGGMGVSERNFTSQADYQEFLDKYDLGFYNKQVQEATSQAKATDDAEIMNMAYTEAATAASKISQICSELLPKEWEEKGSHIIADQINEHPNRRNKEMTVVYDKNTKIADVILPGGALSGGNVEMPNGDKRPFYITPDEVMSGQERKEAGAKVVSNQIPGFNKDKISAALLASGVSYVRFFNKDGYLKYHPDDSYFENKEVYGAKLNGKELSKTTTFDVSEAVKSATEIQFDRIQMVRDDNNGWAMYLKPVNEAGFAVSPDKGDLNRFFTTVKQNQAEADVVRNELAQKYYAMAKANPSVKSDLFGSVPEGIDPLRIKRVNIFKTKDDKILCVPIIDGMQKVQPREVSKQQWQRMWITDDVNQYKTNLAATLFADILRQQAQTETTERNNNIEVAKAEPEVAHNFEGLKQYENLKDKYEDSTLLMKVGESYAAYGRDAVRVGDILGIALKEMMPPERLEKMGFITLSAEEFSKNLPKLNEAGLSVAVQDLKETKNDVAMETSMAEENNRRSGMRM